MSAPGQVVAGDGLGIEAFQFFMVACDFHQIRPECQPTAMTHQYQKFAIDTPRIYQQLNLLEVGHRW